MSKNQSELEEELNESLDFLEEEAPSVTTNSSTNYVSNYISKYWPPTTQHKQIAILSAVGIIGVLIIWWIMHPTSKLNNRMPMPSPIKPAANSNINSMDLKSIPKDPNTKEQPLNKGSETISSAPLPKVEQMQPNQSNVQLPTQNNLTWQELKKSINADNTGTTAMPQQQQPATVTQQKAPDTAVNNGNSEASSPIENFEKPIKSQFKELVPDQSDHSNKIQESIQELKDVTTNITADLLTNVNQIKELQNNLKELSRSISNITNTIGNSMDSIDSKILNLTSTIDNLSTEIKNLKKHLQDEDSDLIATIKKSETDLFSNSPEYVVHAVIPGRAWLKSSSGQIITVTEGDLLGDYGKVAFIDPNNNIVRTSSGVVFR